MMDKFKTLNVLDSSSWRDFKIESHRRLFWSIKADADPKNVEANTG